MSFAAAYVIFYLNLCVCGRRSGLGGSDGLDAHPFRPPLSSDELHEYYMSDNDHHVLNSYRVMVLLPAAPHSLLIRINTATCLAQPPLSPNTLDDIPHHLSPLSTSPTGSDSLHPRDAVTTTTLQPTKTQSDDAQATVTATTTNGLTVAKTPIPLAATIGLIMPNPWQPLYVGESSSWAFRDAVD